MNTEQKNQLLEKIEKATRIAVNADENNTSWKYGHLNGLLTAADIMGIPNDEVEAAKTRGIEN